MRHLLAATFLTGALCMPGAVWAKCTLAMEAPGQVRFIGESGAGYDSFARSLFETGFTLTVENQDEANPCEALLSFQRAPGGNGLNGPGGARLDYQVAPAGSRSTIIDVETDVGRPPHAISLSLAPGQTITRPLAVRIPAGHVVPSGSYNETLLVRIIDREDLDVVAERSVQVTTNVVQQALIMLYDGALARPSAGETGTRNRRLDFGQLEEGETASVTMLIQSNDDYSLRITSPHRGALWHTVQGSSQQVAYAAYLGDRRLNLGSGEDMVSGKLATDLAGVALPLRVQIGAVGIARAGRYEDQLTISVLPDS